MNNNYAPPPNFLNDNATLMESLQMGLESSSEEDLQQNLDMPTYIDYEPSPWLTLSDGTTSSTGSPAEYDQESQTPAAQISKRDPSISRQNRRRAQNRQSQKQFRERKQKGYDTVIAQLKTQDGVIAGLRAENNMLHMSLASLQREKHNTLEAVVSLCRSMGEVGGGGRSGSSGGDGGGGEDGIGVVHVGGVGRTLGLGDWWGGLNLN